MAFGTVQRQKFPVAWSTRAVKREGDALVPDFQAPRVEWKATVEVEVDVPGLRTDLLDKAQGSRAGKATLCSQAVIVWHTGRVDVDLARLARQMGCAAATSKGKRSVAGGGRIVVRRVTDPERVQP